MEIITHSGLELQIKQFRLLHQVSRIWYSKAEPHVSCFEIEREPDGTYSLTFLNDKQEAISDPYQIVADHDLNIIVPDCSCIITYNLQTGELSSADKIYIPDKSILQTAEEWREHLAGRLEEADDLQAKETLEYNRRIILNWICCEWTPQSKEGVPNILISRSIPSEYELRFLKEGKSILPESYLIEQDYQTFFFFLNDDRIDITYFPAVDMLLVAGTYYQRAATQRQEV